MKRDLTVGILLWNSIDHLEDLYSSIANQDILDNFDLLIIDNGSKDASVDFSRKFFANKNVNVRIIENETNLGFCRGANQLIQETNTDYFLLLNSDVKFGKEFFKNILTNTKNSNDDVIGLIPKALYFYDEARINNFGNNFSPFGLWQGKFTDKIDHTSINTYECMGGLFISPIFKINMLKQIGGFIDEFGSYGEDFDVSYRSRIMGYKWIADSDSIIYHKFQASIKDNNVDRRKWYINGFRNAFYVLIINLQLINLIYVLPIFFARVLTRYNIYSFQNNYSFFETNTLFFKTFLRKSDFTWIKSRRRFVQDKRVISDFKVWKL